MADKIRGVFEHVPSSDDRRIRQGDQDGWLHREKFGPREMAVDAYRKRTREVGEGRLFPDLPMARARAQNKTGTATDTGHSRKTPK